MHTLLSTECTLTTSQLFPVYTNLLVIAICYACVAPLVLLFAAMGLYLFYLAYKYNMLFVSNANIDTKGRVYPRALQHLFVGLYVAEVCLAGLFGIATGESVGALGPLILMIILLVFTALYHISLNSALGPLINYLPKSLETEEQRLLEEDSAAAKGETGSAALHSDTEMHNEPSFLQKFMRPDIFTDYTTLRRLVPKEVEIRYSPGIEDNAYFHPSISSKTPLLWIPRDPMGISRIEIEETSKITPMSDDNANLDEKNTIIWGGKDGRPPIYAEPIYY